MVENWLSPVNKNEFKHLLTNEIGFKVASVEEDYIDGYGKIFNVKLKNEKFMTFGNFGLVFDNVESAVYDDFSLGFKDYNFFEKYVCFIYYKNLVDSDHMKIINGKNYLQDLQETLMFYTIEENKHQIQYVSAEYVNHLKDYSKIVLKIMKEKLEGEPGLE